MVVLPHSDQQKLSGILQLMADSIGAETISLRDLLALVGEQGMLLFCILLTVPFLLPVSIPGISTPFGLLIVFIGVGVLLNKGPILPARLMERRFAAEQIKIILRKGASLLTRVDHVIQPRLLLLSTPRVHRCNGVLLILVAVLLMLPFGAIPFTNTLPAWVILLICIGMLQRDGVFVALGYLLAIVTLAWFSFLGIGLVVAGQSISDNLW
ncbi:MAG: exopolysaccharide biosynthesis protein [Shewanella sp.]|uniref:exopolysaccharide biosynthesis protein n=1 Tax=Shewanella sp. TaxID=50422 RepID=UPI003F3F3F82